MNIIGNNCLGARLYEVTNQPFPNPFMWMLMHPSDFFKLVCTYDDLDLSKVSFALETWHDNPYETVVAILENDIAVHYIHYIQDETKSSPVKEKATNILYSNILSYAKNKWFSRMNRSKESPTFLYSFNYSDPGNPAYESCLNDIFDLRTNHRIIILLHDGKQIQRDVPNNITLIPCDPSIMELNGTQLAMAVKDKIFNDKEMKTK